MITHPEYLDYMWKDFYRGGGDGLYSAYSIIRMALNWEALYE